MVRHIMNLRPKPGEDIDQFHRRVSRTVASECRSRGLWSVRWANSVAGWACHLCRNTKNGCQASRLLHVRPLSELAERRSLHDGRPCVRSTSGFINRRHLESVAHAFEYLHSQSASVDHIFERSVLDDGTPSSLENLLSRL